MKEKIITQEQKRKAELQIKEYQKIIGYDTKDYTLELLVSKFEKEDYYIPPYQRRFVWKESNKSLFIESVLLGLPIPFMFFAECDDGKLEIIDGAQRMQTLVAFTNNEFKLTKLQKLTDLEGFGFSDLSEVQQRKYYNRTFRIIVLDAEVSNDIRQDLFYRINTTGKKANDSEVRRGSYPGAFTNFIEKCCENSLFKRLCPISVIKELRYERFELVLRFFAYLNCYKEFDHDVSSFLDKYLSENLNDFNENLFEVEFCNMLGFVEKNYKFGFAKSKGAKTTPRVRFEALSVGTALALRECPDLTISNVDWLDGDEFKELTTSDASNNQGKLVRRVEFVRDKLLGAKI